MEFFPSRLLPLDTKTKIFFAVRFVRLISTIRLFTPKGVLTFFSISKIIQSVHSEIAIYLSLYMITDSFQLMVGLLNGVHGHQHALPSVAKESSKLVVVLVRIL